MKKHMLEQALLHYIEDDTVTEVVLVSDFLAQDNGVMDEDAIKYVELVRRAAEKSLFIGVQIQGGKVYLFDSMTREFHPGEKINRILRS